MKRTCYICRIEKDINDFYKNKGQPSGYDFKCKDCKKEYNKNHKSHMKESSKIWADEHKERVKEISRKGHLKRKYSISPEDYNRLMKQQNNKCLICHRIPDKKLFIDHNHKTGKVRGLLCQNCNLMIGNAGEDINILLSGIEYLRRNANV